MLARRGAPGKRYFESFWPERRVEGNVNRRAQPQGRIRVAAVKSLPRMKPPAPMLFGGVAESRVNRITDFPHVRRIGDARIAARDGLRTSEDNVFPREGLEMAVADVQLP